MTSTKSKIMFVLALIFSGLAAWAANVWIEQNVQKGTGTATVESEKVVVATMDIEYGQTLTEKHLKIVDWPKNLLPASYFTSLEQLQNKVTKKAIAEGAVLNDKWVVDHLDGSRLASLIETNKRAIAVRVDDVVGVAGFLLPGNRVDVLAVKRDKNNDKDVKVSTVLENVKVLAVDQEVSPDGDKPKVVRSVTLELTPQETEEIVKASHEGKIQITLRNPDEKLTERVVPPPPPPEVPVEKPKRHRAEAPKEPKPQPAPVAVAAPAPAPVVPETPKVTIIRGLDVSKESSGIEQN